MNKKYYGSLLNITFKIEFKKNRVYPLYRFTALVKVGFFFCKKLANFCKISPHINGIILPVYRILLQSATYKIFNHTKHLHTAAEIVLKRLCQHQLPSCIIIMKTYYFIMFIMCLQNCT